MSCSIDDLFSASSEASRPTSERREISRPAFSEDLALRTEDAGPLRWLPR